MGYKIQTRKQQVTIECFEELVSYFGLSLREIEKSLTSFAIIQNIFEGKLNLDYSDLSVFISIIKSVSPEVYRKLSKNNITYEELLTETSLNGLESEAWGDKPEGHPLKWLLKYFLSTDKEAAALLEKGNYLESRISYGRRDTVKSICDWLETFKRD